jgi:hypothetical protein
MKKIIVVCLLLAIAASVLCAAYVSFNKAPVEEQEEIVYWEDMPENTNPRLQYFGYYHFGNHIKEVADYGHSNITKVDGDDIEELTEYLDNGFRVFIMIRHMFFKDNKLNPDWENRWEAVKEAIDPHIDQILGFYVDEPVRKKLFTSENIGKSMESFHFACQQVLKDYPGKRMMSVMTIDDINDPVYSREYFKYCTDLGYDYYPRWNDSEVRKNIRILEEQIAIAGQDIWLIPKAFYTVDYESDLYGLIEDTTIPIGKDVLDWIKGTYRIAVEDHRIVGIYVFSYDDSIFTVDLRRFFLKDSEYYNEEIFGTYNQIGKAIIR